MDAAVEFIRKYGKLTNLDEEPYFGESGKMHPRFLSAMRDPEHDSEVIASEMYMPDQQVVADFERTRVKLAKEQFPNKRFPEAGLLETIADSDENVLVDLCSGSGKRITLPFARRHPKVAVFMYDSQSDEDLSREIAEEQTPEYPEAHKLFNKQVARCKDIGTFMNRALEANGYDNVIYNHMTLSFNSYRLDINGITRDSRVHVTGLMAPAGIGNVAAMIGIKMSAEMIIISNSGIEYIQPDEFYFRMMKLYLRSQLSADEIQGAMARIHDKKSLFQEHEKYDYTVPGQRMFASTLKLIYVLGQKHFLEQFGYSAEVYEMEPDKIKPYNKPEHLLVAHKKE